MDRHDHTQTETAAAPAAQERRHRRRSVLWPVEIVSKPAIRCTLTDISIAGARMVVSKPLAQGDILVIRSRRFTAKAQVAWTGDGCVGLSFLEPDDRLEKALDAP